MSTSHRSRLPRRYGEVLRAHSLALEHRHKVGEGRSNFAFEAFVAEFTLGRERDHP